MPTRRMITLIMVICAFGLPVSCSRGTEAPRREIKINGAGATFPQPLYRSWIQEYGREHPELTIAYEAVGSGEGVRRFLKDEVDFGGSDAAMTDEEIGKARRGVKLIPATAGLVVLAYNLKSEQGVLRLPREVYAAMFTGEIGKWDDPRIASANPGLALPSLDIILVTRAESSGTTYAFTNHLVAASRHWQERGTGVGKVVQWPAKAMSARGNEGVAGRIKMTEGSVGYLEYGYAQRAGLAMAVLENKAGNFVAPSPAAGRNTLSNTQHGMPENRRMFFPDPPGDNSYPIVTYSWILLHRAYPDSVKGNAVKDFVKWGITKGQKYAEGLGLCPLPARIVDLGVKDIEGIE